MESETPELPKTSPASEYLAEVSRTVARYGHRDVTGFVRACTLAKTALNYSQEISGYATHVRNFLIMGQAQFVPGYKYFDAAVAVEYAALVAKYNSLKL